MWRPFAECVSDCDVHSDDEIGARKKKYLSQDAKQILLNIYNTLMEENNEGQTKNIQRTSQLTKVPIGTIYKAIKNNAEPRKQRSDKGAPRKIKEYEIDIIRQQVYCMYRENVVPTIECLHKKINDESIDIKCSKTTLWRTLKKAGFKFGTIDKRRTIMESSRLQKIRYEYLMAIKKYRQEGRFICYLDETWYDTHDTICKGWVDNSGTCQLDAPVSRGKRIIILHAGSEKGWIAQPLLSAKNVKCSSLDYHEDMTSSLFEEWFCNTLLPNLPESSVIVMDNAPYHSRQQNKVPTKSNNKKDIKEFLEANNVYYEEHYTKKQLLEVMNTKEYLKDYYVDNRAKEAGHTILRLPPYHCIFNPIELIWAQLKNTIRRTNKTPKFSESTITHIKNAMEHITADNWKNAVKHARAKENEYMDMYNIVPPLIINLQYNSESDTDIDFQDDSITSDDDL